MRDRSQPALPQLLHEPEVVPVTTGRSVVVLQQADALMPVELARCIDELSHETLQGWTVRVAASNNIFRRIRAYVRLSQTLHLTCTLLYHTMGESESRWPARSGCEPAWFWPSLQGVVVRSAMWSMCHDMTLSKPSPQLESQLFLKHARALCVRRN